MIDNYIVNGEIARDKVAMDVKYRKITRNEIVKLCNNAQIKKAFIGSAYSDKRPKKEWNKDYLNRLSYAVVSESFNLDYLLYLDQVAEFVSKATFKKVTIASVVIVIIMVAGVIVYRYIIRGV